MDWLLLLQILQQAGQWLLDNAQNLEALLNMAFVLIRVSATKQKDTEERNNEEEPRAPKQQGSSTEEQEK